jgi:hypothetical protein
MSDSTPDRAAFGAADEQRRRRAADHALACPDPERCPECAAAVVPLAVAVDEALARHGIGRERG